MPPPSSPKLPSQNPSSTAPSSEDQSFTQMDLDRDLESIGAQCQFPYCHQLDFLPFRCESCKGTFCLDHRTETSHKCSHAGEWAAARRKHSVGSPCSKTSLPSQKPTLLTATQCSDPRCKTLINTLQNTGVHCQTCNRQYCLKHRLREDHDCSKLTPLGARPTNNTARDQAEKARLAFSRLRTWGKEKSQSTITNIVPKPKPTSPAARLVALNNLKKTAKGDDKLDPSKRIYLHVEAEAATTTSKFPRAELFFSADWSVGRMLDEAAKRLQVANLNNRANGEEQRLRVYHVEGGRLLEFSEKVGGVLGQGNTVVLLRGVGAAVPDLIEA